MNKQQALTALNNGAVLAHFAGCAGLSASASINGQTVRIDTALNLMGSILKMDKKESYTTFWSLKTEAK